MIAVVLAGGPSDEVARSQNAANKAFVRIAGITLVERTLRPLHESTNVQRIIAVAPESQHDDPALALANDFRRDGVRIRDSLRSGLDGLPPDDLVLVAASDLPVLSVAAIDDFVEQSRTHNPDIAYCIVEKSVHLAKYPTVPHTWARLREGTYCGAGLIALRPRVLPALDRFIEALGHARKNPLQLASLFGWDMLALFALRQLTVANAERRASKMLAAPVRAIISPFPESGVNVDRASDIALAEALVSG